MSKKSPLSISLALMLSLILGSAAWAQVYITASSSCRTEIQNADTNRSDSSKLSVRADEKSAKSWIKFDLDGLDVTSLKSATLTVTLHEGKSGDRNFDISAVNDDCTDNIDWAEREITWNNAPGNDTESYTDLDASKTTLVATVEFTDGEAGDAFTVDILEILESDSDGIVQFVLHNSNGLMNFATHDHSETDYQPYITAEVGARSQARKPYPTNDSTDIYQSTTLGWTPGAFVGSLSPKHQIFFGTDFNDVNDAVDGVTQDSNEYSIPEAPLAFNTTYYWRVDEANSTTGWDRGSVWAFTTEPFAYAISGDVIAATASTVSGEGVDPQNTCNGVGLDDNDVHSKTTTEMWVSDLQDPNTAWISYAFDQPYKLAQMMVWNGNQDSEVWIGAGIKDALIEYSLNGSDWITWGITQFTKATDEQITEVDLGGIMAQQLRITAQSNWGGLISQYSLSEVRFFNTPVLPRELSPAQDSNELDPSVTLKWRAGREAVTHEVYFGSNADDLTLAGTVTGVPYASYSTDELDLQLGQTYAWQIVEVNEDAVPSSWASEVMSFTVADQVVVDDFESYNNNGATYSQIYQTWIDGYGFTYPEEVAGNGSGAYIGYDPGDGDIMEKTIVHGGSQSAPLSYGNDDEDVSEATRTFDKTQDWTRAGISTLSIAFYGEADNDGDLYIKINNRKVSYNGDAADISAGEWKVWEIDLSTVNTDLDEVESMTLGMEDGEGLIYIDDIILY